MGLQKNIMEAETWKEKVEFAHDGLRDFIDKHPDDIFEYGDACFAFGFLSSLAKDAAKELDTAQYAI